LRATVGAAEPRDITSVAGAACVCFGSERAAVATVRRTVCVSGAVFFATVVAVDWTAVVAGAAAACATFVAVSATGADVLATVEVGTVAA
jgi:hypothetical protein